jgi:two-component system, cell cycle sensor histidine kinase and response regulator CckA
MKPVPFTPMPPSAGSPKNHRILIVDDNEAIHQDFRKILGSDQAASDFDAEEAEMFGAPTHGTSERAVFELSFALQGAEALEIVKAAKREGRRFSLVFTDVRMPPGWDGLETAAKLWEEDPDLQVVICTAYSDKSWEEMMEKIGSPERVLILKKPFDTIEVLQLAHALTEKWALLQSARRNTEELEQRVAERTQDLQDANEKLCVEIATRRQAEERIREQAAFLDKAQDAIFVQTLDNRVLYWNRSAERLYGLPVHKVIDHPIPTRIHRDGGQIAEAKRITLEKGDWSGELSQYNQLGGELTVESRWTLVLDEAGRPKSILVINTDITEKKKMAAHLLRTQRLESIGTLASGIAHDLNNVLQPISLSIDLLTPRVTDPGSRSTLEMMGANAQRATSLIRQLLLFARGVDGQRLTVQPVTLAREVANIIENTFPKTIGFRLRYDEAEAWPLLGDSTQLHQVLLNLCVNARDAMPEGGELGLSVENITIDTRFATNQPEAVPGTYVVFTVTDTGGGIPLEVREKIFDPFFTTKEQGKGTGLGLSTAMSIVRSHHGFLTFESKPGEGTAFRVFLPASAIPSESKARPPKSANRNSGTARGDGELVLVVDDETSICFAMNKLLECFGYRAISANDGAEGLRLFREKGDEIKVVISDMAMPGMDGQTFVGELKKIDRNAKIIITTGMASKTAVDAVTRLGITHIINKPCGATILLQAIQELLSGREQEERNAEDLSIPALPASDSTMAAAC